MYFSLIGAPQPHPLECVAVSDPRLVWVSYRTTVKGFRRGKEVCRFHGHKGNVTVLLPFGEHLISIDDQNCLKIWSVREKGQKKIQRENLQKVLFIQSCMEICTLTPTCFPSRVPFTRARTSTRSSWGVGGARCSCGTFVRTS